MRYIITILFVAIAAVIVAAPVLAADERPTRLVGNERYQILEARELYIYSKAILVRKGASERSYYFSAGPNGEVLPLTILNLKKAFPANHGFHDRLDMMFKNDSQLTKFDEFHRMYKVNWLLETSK